MLESIDPFTQLGISPHRAFGGHRHSLGQDADITTERLGYDVEVSPGAVLGFRDQPPGAVPGFCDQPLRGQRTLLDFRAEALLELLQRIARLLIHRATFAVRCRCVNAVDRIR